MDRAKYITPLSTRYVSVEMNACFGDQKKFSTWRQLWTWLAEAERELGLEISEEQMLDIAESIFNMIAHCLMMHNLTVRQTFGGEDIIYNLPEFEGETNVEVMTADDFITRCYEIGV